MCGWILGALISLPLMAQQDAREAALGAQIAHEIRSHSTVVTDPSVRAYVSALATKLAGSGLALTLEVITGDGSATHEPAWLPGGYVFVSTDLIAAARDESEFAGVFAHTLAHQIGHDTERLRMQALAANPAAIPLIWIGGEESALPRAWIVRRRPFELEADALAVKLLVRAGYDPEALARYLTRLNPDDTERIEAIYKAVGNAPRPTALLLDSSEFQRVREKFLPRAQRPSLYLFR